MKTSPLICHLELAKRTFVDDPPLGMSHLSAAVRELKEIGVNRSETGMTYEDWDHVVTICMCLNAPVTVFGSREAQRDLDCIHYQATQFRDR